MIAHINKRVQTRRRTETYTINQPVHRQMDLEQDGISKNGNIHGSFDLVLNK